MPKKLSQNANVTLLVNHNGKGTLLHPIYVLNVTILLEYVLHASVTLQSFIWL